MSASESGAVRRVAVVTGAGTGLGRAYARDLAARGWRVLVNNRLRQRDAGGLGGADRVAAEIRAAGGEAQPNYEDVCAANAGERIVEQAMTTWGRLDALVNNAGVDQHAAFHKLDDAAFRATFEVNFFGSVAVTRAAWPVMRAAGHGRVVLSASSAGLHGLHGLSAYAASKAALIAFARSIAAEGASRDVLCNVVAPYAATRMTEPHLDAAARVAMAPERAAPLVAALCAPQCRANGQVFVVGAGQARRATTVESGRAVSLAPDPDAALQTLDQQRLGGEGTWREFRDALTAYEDFLAAPPR
jgi:NAD(P)-dependent dehydrogenase (short-subunit alcohol dehydrogenase family)